MIHELGVTRFIAATPETVWYVMTNRIAEWWCPRPWRAEFTDFERFSGGALNCTIYWPDGEMQPNRGTVLAWDEGRRFAFTDVVVGDLEPVGPFMIGIWTIESDGGMGTRYAAVARHWTGADMARHRDMGFEAGWGAAADQLKTLCEASR